MVRPSASSFFSGLIDDVGLPITELQPSGSGWLDQLPFFSGGEEEPVDPAVAELSRKELAPEERRAIQETVTRNAMPLVALAAHSLQPGGDRPDTRPQQAPVGLQLGFTRAAQADPALLPLQVGPAAHQAGAHML